MWSNIIAGCWLIYVEVSVGIDYDYIYSQALLFVYWHIIVWHVTTLLYKQRGDNFPQYLWARNVNLAKFALLFREKWSSDQLTILYMSRQPSCFIICMIGVRYTKKIIIKAKRIFTRIQLLAHKPFVKSGLIPGLRLANERRRCKVTPFLIGWAQT